VGGIHRVDGCGSKRVQVGNSGFDGSSLFCSARARRWCIQPVIDWSLARFPLANAAWPRDLSSREWRGAGLAAPLIAYILLHQGWRWSFWISAVIGLVAGLVWSWLARDKPEQHSWDTSEKAETIRSGLPDFAETLRPFTWDAILSTKDVSTVTFSYFCCGYLAYIFFAWFFIYLSAVRGLDLKSSAYYSMLPFLAMAAYSPLGGWISDFTAG
jgi:sugar phosphate permease